MESTTDSKNQQDEIKKENVLQKLWKHRKYFIIEPFVLCWILPGSFFYISMPNLDLEKACRVNLGYPEKFCINVIEKQLNDIDCSVFEFPKNDGENWNSSLLFSDKELFALPSFNVSALKDYTISIDGINSSEQSANNNVIDLSLKFKYTFCKIEIDTQKKVTFINGIRSPLAAIFPIIVILFAGGWSDRKGLRKPCMIFPMIGEILASAALLISSIFFESLPMEFSSILEKLLPALFGGDTLMFMAIFSYLTAATEEGDRTFRFGIFSIFVSIVQIVSVPFSGTMYKNLGYVYVFLLGLIIHILGLLYLIFFVNEIKENPSNEEDNSENTNTSTNPENKIDNLSKNLPKKNCFMEFFDLTLAYDCFKIFLKKRPQNGRIYIIILVITSFLSVGPISGEVEYFYQVALITFRVDANEFSIYNGYSVIMGLIGTTLMTTVFSKIFHCSDPLIGFIASVGVAISRPMFAYSKAITMYYAATTTEMFVSVRGIALKSIISSFVAVEELGRIYSIVGISDAIGQFIFPPIYSAFYANTVNDFPGAVFLFSDLFYIPTAFVFGFLFLLKFRKNQDSKNQVEINQQARGSHEVIEQ